MPPASVCFYVMSIVVGLAVVAIVWMAVRGRKEVRDAAFGTVELGVAEEGERHQKIIAAARRHPMDDAAVVSEMARVALPLESPFLVYGTAWKKEETARLVSRAIVAGFRHVDTACQPKHYNEAGVGEGIAAALDQLQMDREDIYIQTKYTSIGGQDRDNLPYDQDAPLSRQVAMSVRTSLKNLRVEYIDGLLMHSPMPRFEQSMEVWSAMEEEVRANRVRQIGISNCYDFQEFKRLYESADIKPSVLQNRFYSDSGFDTKLRAFCAENGVLYQSFWTLTANRKAHTDEARRFAKKKGLASTQLLLYAFMMELGHTPLDGTTSEEHLEQDVELMQRLQRGEKIFDEEELGWFSRLLGIPGH